MFEALRGHPDSADSGSDSRRQGSDITAPKPCTAARPSSTVHPCLLADRVGCLGVLALPCILPVKAVVSFRTCEAATWL